MTHGQIGLCAYRSDGAYSEVILPGGGVVASYPQEAAEYAALARELGYVDGRAMSLEHDAIHAALAGVFGAVSPTLSAVADGREHADAWMEEEMVKMVAARLNDPDSDDLPGGGLVRWLRGQLRPDLEARQ